MRKADKLMKIKLKISNVCPSSHFQSHPLGRIGVFGRPLWPQGLMFDTPALRVLLGFVNGRQLLSHTGNYTTRVEHSAFCCAGFVICCNG